MKVSQHQGHANPIIMLKLRYIHRSEAGYSKATAAAAYAASLASLWIERIYAYPSFL